MSKCYKCQTRMIITTTVKEGITLDCDKCLTCGEEYFTLGQIKKFDVLSGRKKRILEH